ncbi:hypothetical protein SPHINGO8AM_130286 [Sphingomonas sp. 8AM]|nr:hypothetical protein SPHINGO8AM_130286 [Sphingomonas sp. 8AM]
MIGGYALPAILPLIDPFEKIHPGTYRGKLGVAGRCCRERTARSSFPSCQSGRLSPPAVGMIRNPRKTGPIPFRVASRKVSVGVTTEAKALHHVLRSNVIDRRVGDDLVWLDGGPSATKRLPGAFCRYTSPPSITAEAPADFIVRSKRMLGVGAEHHSCISQKLAGRLIDHGPSGNAVGLPGIAVPLKFVSAGTFVKWAAKIGHYVWIALHRCKTLPMSFRPFL